MISLDLAGCNFKATLTAYHDAQGTTAKATVSDRLKFFIRGKKISNLGEARKTITLSIEAMDPDSGASFTLTEGLDTGVPITLTPCPRPAPSPSPSPTPTHSSSTSSQQPSPSPSVTPTPSPSPTTTGPDKTVNIKAETLLGSDPVARVRNAFQDTNGATVGSVTIGTDCKATIVRPAVKPPLYRGAYYTLTVTLPPGNNYSADPSPYSGEHHWPHGPAPCGFKKPAVRPRLLDRRQHMLVGSGSEGHMPANTNRSRCR